MERLVTKGYRAVELRTKALEGIMEALRESSVRIIRINAAQKSSTDGCKLLLTPRSLDLLRFMDAERNSFKVEI
ncbi:hypothetical protein V6N13_148161 [Hibiscus sabdariffa]